MREVDKFYESLIRFFEKEQRVPSIREMMRINKLASPRSVSQFYNQLERQGLIKRRRGSRNIKIVGYKFVWIY